MYFEARINNIKDVVSIEEAAVMIKDNPLEFDGYRVIVDKIEIIFVNDNVADGCDRIKEVAIVNQTEGFVIDSITIDWVKDHIKLAQIFKEAIDTNKPQYKAKVATKIEECGSAWFTCSCCGEEFEGNYQYQAQFDKDSGYGLCAACEDLY
jgi:hypothetical protein